MKPLCTFARVTTLSLSLATAAFAAEPATPSTQPSDTAPAPFQVDHDAPLDPVERIDRDANAFSRLRVEFNGIRRDRVPAYLYLPKGGAKPRPSVLLQYGSGGNKNTNYIVALGEQFASRGFVVLTIDAPLRGERRPKTAKSKWQRLFDEPGRVPWYLGDYSRAVDYLLTRPEVDAKRVGYAGISWGAITGITFVAHEPRVTAIAAIVAGGNFLGTLRTEIPEATQDAARRVDPIYHVTRVAPRPLLLLNVTRDQLVPRFYSESLHRAAGEAPSVTKQWLDTDHFFSGVDRRAVLEGVIDFMEASMARR